MPSEKPPKNRTSKNRTAKKTPATINRTGLPKTAEFNEYMTSNWGQPQQKPLEMYPEKQYCAKRRATLSSEFPRDRLIIEAGNLKVRANDTDYRFRPHSSFAHLTGLGIDYEPDSVLVFEPVKIKSLDQKYSHIVTLYIEPMKDRTDEQFFRSASHGEFWIGRRPDLAEFSKATGILTKPLSQLRDDLKKHKVIFGKTRFEREFNYDEKLHQACSELRLIKDLHEIQEVKKAIEATYCGFENVISNLPNIVGKPRGERIVEGLFITKALEKGNSVGYETIAASGDHATTLHWIRNNGELKNDELLLLDAGVEVDSLYTADITRTIPINGTFTLWQRKIYDIVLEAANEAIKQAKPGNHFFDPHNAAMEIIAKRLYELEILRVPPEIALDPEKGGQHRRWMCHGTSHHLGLDVHDCAAARHEKYIDAQLEPGMIFTIEPGLYFKSDDLLVPPEFRGIGIRIEDDILITEDGSENLSARFPRNPEHVESWVRNLQNL